VQRAEDRAERFEHYSEKRSQDAERVREGVQAIAGRFELGQPILVGHHSEPRARKDAERIQSGMRRAVQLWDTSAYWAERAQGALAHAKYKELPDVRARRIKGIEADKRKRERIVRECSDELAQWQSANLTREMALGIAYRSNISGTFSLAKYPRNPPASQYEGQMSLWSALKEGVVDHERAQTLAISCLERSIAYSKRWLTHYENRLSYERAMLGEQGGLPADKFNIEPGGRVLIRREWLVVMRVNKRDGRITSVRTNARFVPVRGIEEVEDYQAPNAEEAQKVAEVTKIGPLANYPGKDFVEVTSEQWEKFPKIAKAIRPVPASETAARHRVRVCMSLYCVPNETDMNKRHRYRFVFITDAKRVNPPAAQGAALPATFERRFKDAPAQAPSAPPEAAQETEKGGAGSQFEAMRQTLKNGIQVVAVPQLFQTPPELADELIIEADIETGMAVLDPSAGDGALLAAVQRATNGATCTAIEIHPDLCDHLRKGGLAAAVHHGDFLTLSPQTVGRFDRIVMNPPFADGGDIKHIEHALKFLQPGGRLAAICANGPRQTERLGALAQRLGGTFRALPGGEFKSVGTSVRSAMFVVSMPAQATIDA
jgi:phospholipid N-methyltransferase